MEPQRLDPFPYDPLQLGEIRLLHVQSGVSDSISIQLRNVSLATEPTFWALSYVWGSWENPATVLINESPFRITRNLYNALDEYRRQFPDDGNTVGALLWVDAICINQNDQHEKSVQVPRMSDIYGKCERVLAWLGPVEDEDSDDVRQLAEKLKQFESPTDPSAQCLTEEDRINSFRVSAHSDEHAAVEVESVRRALRSIGHRPWFRRIWILQEAVLAQQQPLLLCGRHDLGYEIFFKTWVLMLDPSHDGQLLHTFMAENPVRFKAIELVYKKILHARHKSQGEAKRDVDQQRQCAVELLELLNETTDLEATVAHDRLYALLGLLSCNPLPNALQPDYTKPFATLCHELVMFILAQSQDIRVLNLGTLGNLTGVPSWTPDLRNSWMARVNIATCPGKSFHVSEDGQTLTMPTIVLGRCVSVYGPAQPDPTTGLVPPSAFMALDERIIQVASAIRTATRMEVMAEWLRFHLANIFTEERLDQDPSIVQRVMMAYACMVHNQPLESLGTRFGTREQLQGADGMVRSPTLQKSMIGHSIFVLEDGTAGELLGDTVACVGDAMCVFPGISIPLLIRPDDNGKCKIIGQVSLWKHIGAGMPAELLESYRLSFVGAHNKRETKHEVRMVSLS
ncbi:related to het-6 - heterokaryon incompatibility protein [Fusarium torulosum]|uniref:Related to het-6 - heterokaryon incompatibility protein n=1 Tax=Fusarium torulosum TaxID=33205 RepID=A0AAE8M0E6_9HYPO|nr:related to het-6 - heterokaryon incompatibility protein [Fusarium torulosum]